MNSLFADITWRPIFNDPNPLAWCITIAHWGACWLCFSALKRQRAILAGDDNAIPLRFWFILAVLMSGLGLNKQLDLQTLLTQYLRDVARRDGWYEQRRTYQFAFVCGVTSVGLVCAALSSYVLWKYWRQCCLAYLGLVYLITFVVIRAASFHHLDTLLYHLPLVGNRMNAGLELGGSLLVSLGAYLASRQPPRSNEIPDTD